MHAHWLRRTFHSFLSPRTLEFGLMKKDLELETLSILKQLSMLALFAFVGLYSSASVKRIVSSWLFRMNREA